MFCRLSDVEDIFTYIQSNVEMAPIIIPSLMMLAGFNIPVPEDGMLFLAGILAAKHPEMLEKLFLGVLVGAYSADMICYGVARFLGPRLYKIKWFAKMVSKERMAKVNSFYERFGFVTLIVGRFIPFGVRNGLFMTAGFSGMNAIKFAIADFIAALLTCGCYFWLYYSYGETVIEVIKKANVVIFAVLALVVTAVIIKKRAARKQAASI